VDDGVGRGQWSGQYAIGLRGREKEEEEEEEEEEGLPSSEGGGIMQ
jgi:hypothetical protein